jgi:hypothetical protein
VAGGLAASAFPLLGADFLQQFALTVDMHSFCDRLVAGKPIKMEELPAGCAFALLGMRPAAAAEANAARPAAAVEAPATRPAAAAGAAAAQPAPAAGAAAAGRTAGVALHHRLSSCSTTATLQHQLSTCSTTVALPQQRDRVAAPLAAPAAVAGRYTELLKELPAVLCQSKQLPPVIHSVEHQIETEGRPVAAKYRRLDPAKLAAAKKEFADMERQGIIRRLSSCWSSPLHMVKKPDGSWRPCGDFHRLNLQTKPDRILEI